MTVDLVALCIDARDPQLLARFWGGLLGWDEVPDPSPDGAALLPTDDTPFGFRFLPSDAERSGRNRMHPEVKSTSLEDQQAIVAKALDLGASHLDVGQLPEEGHVVLADPEGNEFCVIEPGNRFLAECGFFSTVSSDGSQAVGRFWSDALGWPLVWDQDEETAIRSPRGGPKITWGGPPLEPKQRPRNRLHYDVAPAVGGDLETEVERLLALGARRTDLGPADGRWVVMADPDDCEFCVYPSSDWTGDWTRLGA